MRKTTMSQGSRNMAQNMNDLYSRWEARIDSHRLNKNIAVPSMPALRNYKEAYDFKNYLHMLFIEMKEERKTYKPNSAEWLALDEKSEKVKIMQMSVKQQLHGAKWYRHTTPYSTAIRLLDANLLNIEFDHSTGLLHISVDSKLIAQLDPNKLNDLEDIA